MQERRQSPPSYTSESFVKWRSYEVVLLRNIARQVTAWMNEPSDPAMSSSIPQIRLLTAELFEHRQIGRAKGWQ
jgi:hypothetical protein